MFFLCADLPLSVTIWEQISAAIAKMQSDSLHDLCICMPQGLNPVNQKEVDEKMFSLDGTDNKGKLGANAILGVSLAVARVSSPTILSRMKWTCSFSCKRR